MCGRYASSRSPEDLVEEFDALDPRLIGSDSGVPPLPELSPSWNVAPTDEVYAVLERTPRTDADPDREGPPVRQLRALRWGLVPSWAKDLKIGSRMINARMETVAEKPAFRKAFAARRCIVPADGYYEWYETQQQTAKGKPVKQPFFIRPEGDSVLAMAGLYEIWRDPARAEGDPDRFRWTCTVLTTSATDDLGRIHDRMPLLVHPDMRAAWLDPRNTVADPAAVLVPAQQSGLSAQPVSAAVGNVANNGPGLVEPIPFSDTGEQGTLL
ncbi:MAG: SOS response-associated peptidase [Nocardioidaceae bacterium]|nr:SOS response-associated peptidase [Nocardioidaceae bacterium]